MSNKEIIEKYLRNKGLNDKAIAGVMGNIQQESNFSPTATNRSSGAYGLFQWLGGRKKGLQSYAKSVGKSAGNIYVQLDYFWKELTTTEKKSLEVLQSTNYTSPSDYAVAFERTFERSGGSALTKRKSYAETIYKNLVGGTISTDSSTGISAETPRTDNGVKWWGDIVITVFAIMLVIMGVVFVGLAITSNNTGGKIVKKVAKGVGKNE